MIKQLQENQLALTQGFEGNRTAITSGFDKKDEVKRWNLKQLPGYEAIEKPEMKYEAADINEKIKIIDARIDKKTDSLNENIDLANIAKEEGNENICKYYMKKTKNFLENMNS